VIESPIGVAIKSPIQISRQVKFIFGTYFGWLWVFQEKGIAKPYKRIEHGDQTGVYIRVTVRLLCCGYTV
jgi:hypothetical protein